MVVSHDLCPTFIVTYSDFFLCFAMLLSFVTRSQPHIQIFAAIASSWSRIEKPPIWCLPYKYLCTNGLSDQITCLRKPAPLLSEIRARSVSLTRSVTRDWYHQLHSHDTRHSFSLLHVNAGLPYSSDALPSSTVSKNYECGAH